MGGSTYNINDKVVNQFEYLYDRSKEPFFHMLKERFYKVYNNLPLNLREEVVLVINNEPITWRVAKLEIDSNTKLSEEILEKLEALNII